jgi:hypothetical protein
MHFHLGWLGPAGDFDHKGYRAGDGRYGSVGQQQYRMGSGQKNWTAWNTKPDHSVSPKTTEAPG